MTPPSSHSRRKEGDHEKLGNDSITFVAVSPSEVIQQKFFSGRRVVKGVRVDEGLYERFKPLAKKLFGSVCRSFEGYMASVVALCDDPARFVLLMNRPLRVEQIVIGRDLKRTRRKLVLEETETVERVAVVVKCGFCGKSGVVARFRHLKSGLVKGACSFHAESLREHPKWEEVKV